MDIRLLTIAALAATLAVPASARAPRAVGIGVPDAKSPAFPGARPVIRDVGRCRGIDASRARTRVRSSCGLVDDGWAYSDREWAYANNRSWDSDSFNDWWNDRPDRAFPRWVQEQRGGPCDPDRMWWSGSGWHC